MDPPMELPPTELVDELDPPNEPVEVAAPPPVRPLPEEAEECVLIAVEWLLAGMVWLAVDAPCWFCQAPGEDATYTGLSIEPCRATLLEIWSSFPNVLRGTPRPAESLRKTNESLSFSLEMTSGFSLTATIVGLSGWVWTGGLRRLGAPGRRTVAMF
jgi:hypothetical protein